MRDAFFDSAADRIAFSEAVDFVEQGRTALVPEHLKELYVQKGLWVRAGDELRLTAEGERQHRIALRERFTDG
ncbi:MAG TPA: hypothetical protein VFZ93_14260 [Albitalea sp.]